MPPKASKSRSVGGIEITKSNEIHENKEIIKLDETYEEKDNETLHKVDNDDQRK